MKDLTEEDVFVGLVDHGLFCEKLPPCFSTLGLAGAIGGTLTGLMAITDEKFLKKEIDKRSHDFIRYEALRDINIPRYLGIPHPESYVLQAMTIKKHWTEIRSHCGKPMPRASRIFVRRAGGGRIFEMNYKGKDHYEFEEDEIQWMAGAQFVVKADISACFPSIYTHSISWALTSREDAKKKRGLLALSGNLLDKCTQNLRDGQTNGLLIGPHSSNIIAEIILTQIDVELGMDGHKKFKRYIDDYEFFAESYDEAEKFLRDLSLRLREFELALNVKKTLIRPLPRPGTENWVRELNRFAFPKDEDIKFSVVRSFLDLALELALETGTSATLNYAIKMIPARLNDRAKRLFVQEAINLALAYPYLAPYLDEHVFGKFSFEGISARIADFSVRLVRLGIKKLYPDAIAHGLFFALKNNITLQLNEAELLDALKLDDCIVTVLLLGYAQNQSLSNIESAIRKRSAALKADDKKEHDRQWLLIYQTWTEAELNGNGQQFLASLKHINFRFLSMPNINNSQPANSLSNSLLYQALGT